MKNMFQRLQELFNRKPVSVPSVELPTQEASAAFVEEPQESIEVPENLFIEKEPPAAPEPVAAVQQVNRLEKFLCTDFQRLGYSDGYRYHSVEILDNYRRFLRSEFREQVEHVIDDIKSYRDRLRKEVSAVQALSQKVAQKLMSAIQVAEEHIARLEQEKELSTADEGLVATALHEYRDGFLRGMEDYAEELMVMGNTGIFK